MSQYKKIIQEEAIIASNKDEPLEGYILQGIMGMT